MLGRKRKNEPPAHPFVHTANCAIIRTDPGFQPPWQEIERRTWKRECQCTADYWHAAFVDDRVRLDPYDPATARHLGQCEFASETDPAVLRLALKVKPGLGGD